VRLSTPPARPSGIVEGLPPDLDRVVHRALEADPTLRYPSARAFAEALETWLRRFADTAPAPTPDLAETVAMLIADAPSARIVAAAAASPNAGAAILPAESVEPPAGGTEVLELPGTGASLAGAAVLGTPLPPPPFTRVPQPAARPASRGARRRR